MAEFWSSPGLTGQEGTGARWRRLVGILGGPLGAPTSFSWEDSRASQGLARASQFMVTHDAWPQAGHRGAMSLPEQKLGSSLAWETLHRRPGTNCAPRRGQWSPECLKLWHSVPLGVRTMETLPEP